MIFDFKWSIDFRIHDYALENARQFPEKVPGISIGKYSGGLQNTMMIEKVSLFFIPVNLAPIFRHNIFTPRPYHSKFLQISDFDPHLGIPYFR